MSCIIFTLVKIKIIFIMQSIFIANGNPLRSVSKHIQSGAIVQMVNGRLEGLIPGDLGSNESVFLCFTKNHVLSKITNGQK